MPPRRRAAAVSSDSEEYEPGSPEPPRPAKRARTKADSKYAGLEQAVLSSDASSLDACLPPVRAHSKAYHRPLLLESTDLGRKTRASLLEWYGSVKDVRPMPWREAFLPPEHEEWDEQVKVRAYRVWLSEVMLQQTRVATVHEYFTRWTERWPTLPSLAQATHDEVLAQWKGLGYYSRATRIHQAAQEVVDKHGGRMPSSAAELRAVPGIGPYTAGAISSIVYGNPEAVLDGNVVRVLTRQLGLRAPVKDKAVTDLLWLVAQQLVQRAAEDHGPTPSSVPGDWNQAIMELGSTLCVPLNPLCGQCPIRPTCRTHAEGSSLSRPKGVSAEEPDLEDLCTACEPLEEDVFHAALAPTNKSKTKTKANAQTKTKIRAKAAPKPTRGKQTVLSFAPAPKKEPEPEPEPEPELEKPENTMGEGEDLARVYAQFFPLKKKEGPKPEREVAVCILRGPRGFALEQRPPTGLLASLWQFPTLEPYSHSVDEVHSFAATVARAMGEAGEVSLVSQKGEVHHVFSHFKLIMHIFVFSVAASEGTQEGELACRRRWASTAQVEASTMGTGMVNVFKRYRQSL